MRRDDLPDTRQAILDAAEAVLLERGFDDGAMEATRRRAEVSNGSLYHHFPSKAHLAHALYQASLEDYHASLLAAIGDDVPAEAGIPALVQAHVAWVLRRPDRARVLHELRRAAVVPDVEPPWRGPNAGALATLRRWTEREIAHGRMRAVSFPVWLALVFAPVMQLTPGWLRARRPSVTAEVRHVLAEAAWGAVAPPPAVSPRGASR
jgi:AcrR family transcriptional regulator